VPAKKKAERWRVDLEQWLKARTTFLGQDEDQRTDYQQAIQRGEAAEARENVSSAFLPRHRKETTGSETKQGDRDRQECEVIIEKD